MYVSRSSTLFVLDDMWFCVEYLNLTFAWNHVTSERLAMRILLTVVILDSNVFTGAIDKKNIQYFGKGQEIP